MLKLLGLKSLIEFAGNYALNTQSVLSVENVIVTISVAVHIVSTHKTSNFSILVKPTQPFSLGVFVVF